MPQTTGTLIPCNLCESASDVPLASIDRDGNPLPTVICTLCGLVYTNPRPPQENLRAYYLEQYRRDYKGTWQPKPKHTYRAGKVALERLSTLLPFLKPNARVLDFGAGGGEVVFLMRKLGLNATGFEPNAGYASFARDHLQVPVEHAFYQDAQVEPDSLDLVTAFHVFEHLGDPTDAFRTAAHWLKIGGRLLIEVPHVNALCHWPKHRYHQAHLYHFNAVTLEAFGQKAGLTCLKSWLSSDGGNVSILLEKPTSPPPPLSPATLAANYQHTRHTIVLHKPFRHTFSLPPYRRPFRSLLRNLDELKNVGPESLSPQQRLTKLFDASPLAQSQLPSAPAPFHPDTLPPAASS